MDFKKKRRKKEMEEKHTLGSLTYDCLTVTPENSEVLCILCCTGTFV